MKLKIACIQLNSSGDIQDNIATIETQLARAAETGAELIALPEMAFYIDQPGGARDLYTQDTHPAVKASAEMARKYSVWLLAGSVAVTIDDSGKTVNRSILFDDKGNEVAHYDKIHLFDVEVGDGQSYRESKTYLSGARAVVADTPWAKLGMSVCYDVRFPHLYRALAKAGAEILAVPAAFTQVTGEAHWHVFLRARAIENGCFVIAPAQCGTHQGGRKTYGHAMIVDPWGKIVVEAGTESEIITAEIDLDEVKQARAKLPSLEHDREFEV